jgi:hypothetical protein
MPSHVKRLFRKTLVLSLLAVALSRLSAGASFTPATPLNTPRKGHTATLLPNGNLLVTGGVGTNGNLAGVEMYQLATGAWINTNSMNIPRSYHTATMMPDGKVLIVGGSLSASTEIFDSRTGAWAGSGSMSVIRQYHAATLLNDGKVLIAGGQQGSAYASVEIYDPVAGTWTTTNSMGTPRSGFTATLLPNGQMGKWSLRDNVYKQAWGDLPSTVHQ